jgi:hypothetical protein
LKAGTGSSSGRRTRLEAAPKGGKSAFKHQHFTAATRCGAIMKNSTRLIDFHHSKIIFANLSTLVSMLKAQILTFTM